MYLHRMCEQPIPWLSGSLFAWRYCILVGRGSSLARVARKIRYLEWFLGWAGAHPIWWRDLRRHKYFKKRQERSEKCWNVNPSQSFFILHSTIILPFSSP